MSIQAFTSRYNYSNDSMISMEGSLILSFQKEMDELIIKTTKGFFRFYHEQDCCESVYLENFDGWSDYGVGEEILKTEEKLFSPEEEYPEMLFLESCTGTFYSIQTNSMDLSMRWVGESNGYYSESVDVFFSPLTKKDILSFSERERVIYDKWLESDEGQKHEEFVNNILQN